MVFVSSCQHSDKRLVLVAEDKSQSCFSSYSNCESKYIYAVLKFCFLFNDEDTCTRVIAYFFVHNDCNCDLSIYSRFLVVHLCARRCA